MKLEIYKEAKEEEGEPTIMLGLQYDDDNHSVDLVTTDKEGRVGYYLLNISDQGVRLNKPVSKRLGFPLDKNGRLVVRE